MKGRLARDIDTGVVSVLIVVVEAVEVAGIVHNSLLRPLLLAVARLGLGCRHGRGGDGSGDWALCLGGAGSKVEVGARRRRGEELGLWRSWFCQAKETAGAGEWRC